MTGDTFVNDVEKGPQSPTDTEHTVGGDAIIEMGEEVDVSAHRSSSDSRSRSSVNDASAQPRMSHIAIHLTSGGRLSTTSTNACIESGGKKRPTFLRRVTGSFKSEPDPPGVTEISTRQCK